MSLDDISKHFVQTLQDVQSGPPPNRHARRALKAMNKKRISKAKKTIQRNIDRAVQHFTKSHL